MKAIEIYVSNRHQKIVELKLLNIIYIKPFHTIEKLIR
jgi:hypothetical protein